MGSGSLFFFALLFANKLTRLDFLHFEQKKVTFTDFYYL